MLFVNRVHAFQSANPRGPFYSIRSIRSQAATSEWMAFKSFVVRRTEHVCTGVFKEHESNLLAVGNGTYHADRASVPIWILVVEVVRQNDPVLGCEYNWYGRAD